MIPTQTTLRNRLTTEHIQFILLHQGNYFEKAEEYSQLLRIFKPDNLISSILLWVDMVFSPLITILTAIWEGKPPSIFSVMGIYKTVNLWMEWVQFHILTLEFREWTRIVKSIGGPFISTNDPLYHSYVYADGMQRAYDCWPSLPKN
jgi:hypothetical protein